MHKTKEQISYNMKQVKSKDTKIEVMLRKELWSRGLRYQKIPRKYSGNLILFLQVKKVAVFCDSEFWHGYDWDNKKKEFKSHQDFWIPKIERNIARDKEVNNQLKRTGWTVLRFWGNDIKKNLQACADEIERTVKGKND